MSYQMESVVELHPCPSDSEEGHECQTARTLWQSYVRLAAKHRRAPQNVAWQDVTAARVVLVAHLDGGHASTVHQDGRYH